MFSWLKELFDVKKQVKAQRKPLPEVKKDLNPPTLKTILNKNGQYMSPEEIAKDFIFNQLKDLETIEFIRAGFKSPRTEEREAAEQSTGLNVDAYTYTSLLRWIRNSYGLWHEANPYVNIYSVPNKNNIIDDPRFPDNLSETILLDIRRQLNG